VDLTIDDSLEMDEFLDLLRIAVIGILRPDLFSLADEIEILNPAVQGIVILELNIESLGNLSIVLLPNDPVFASPFVWLCHLDLNVSIHIDSFRSNLPVVDRRVTWFEHCVLYFVIDLLGQFLSLVVGYMPRLESRCNGIGMIDGDECRPADFLLWCMES
jgi:hypothetical protein